MASTALNLSIGINEIAIAGKDMIPSIKEVLQEYLLNKILQTTFNKSDMFLLKDRPSLEDLSIYLCRNYACTAPLDYINDQMDEIHLQSF